MESLKSKIAAVLPETDRRYFSACKNAAELLKQFETCLCNWEKKIEKEHQKSFVSDTLEISINGYIMECLKIFIEAGTFDKNSEICQKIFQHRHVGYNMYCLKNSKNLSDQIREGLKRIFKNAEYEEKLYCAMASFYAQFSGRFDTNEQAIEFLCKFYPKQMDLDRRKEAIISNGLYSHILFAGTSSDFGYAYNGIKKIEEYIGFMDYRIVKKVLRNYERYRVENHPVHRHQIHAIISESRLKNKEIYKFFYLDSVLLTRIIDSLLFVNIEKESGGEFVMDYFSMESFAQPKIVVTRGSDDTPYAYWNASSMNKLELMVEQECIFVMELKKGQIHLWYKGKQDSLVLDFEDWMGNLYFSKNFERNIASYLELSPLKPDFIFSYIYLNNYRNIENQKISFDHRYAYNRREKHCEKLKDQPFPEKFYGEKIYSLNCIVGKNGIGKTSIVDFLRESFFKIKKCVDRHWLKYEHNTVYMDGEWAAALGLDENTEFVVIFRLGRKDYFLTNIEGIRYDQNQITPYLPSVLLREADEGAKILYFSGKIDLYEEEEQNRLTGKKEYIDILNQAHNADYSEHTANLRRIRNMRSGGQNILNQELCYQLTFLRDHDTGMLQKWFGERFKKENLKISNENYRNDLSFQKYLEDLSCRIGPFSSGEYSKFSFLSKLYWCFQGWERFGGDFETMEAKGMFSVKEVVQKEDAVVVFIDEGEVYYHPEWQRQFVQILIDMIEQYSQSNAVQIVLTTNSPFMISDIREEDIVYLPLREENTAQKTFGQNIHMLLKDSFFMEATIGEFAKNQIEWLLGLLNGEKRSSEEVISEVNHKFHTALATPEEIYDCLSLLISNIGEEIYRAELMSMLNAFMESNLNRLEMLKRRKKELEEQIAALEKNVSGGSMK